MFGIPGVFGDLEVGNDGPIDVFPLDPADIHDIYLLAR
jgi:hypothetical protein